MAPLWRFTRNRYGRAVYDALARVGITATVMDEYVRSLDTPPEPPRYRVERCAPAAVASLVLLALVTVSFLAAYRRERLLELTSALS